MLQKQTADGYLSNTGKGERVREERTAELVTTWVLGKPHRGQAQAVLRLLFVDVPCPWGIEGRVACMSDSVTSRLR